MASCRFSCVEVTGLRCDRARLTGSNSGARSGLTSREDHLAISTGYWVNSCRGLTFPPNCTRLECEDCDIEQVVSLRAPKHLGSQTKANVLLASAEATTIQEERPFPHVGFA